MRYILAIFLFVFFVAAVPARAQRLAVLAKCAELFGPSVDTDQNLFEINKDFLLHVEFDRAQVIRISVAPKYFYEGDHADRIEPSEWPLLSNSQVEALMSKISKIRNFGKLRSASRVALITNNTEWMWRQYSGANVELGAVGGSFRLVRLNYFNRISGTVVRKARMNGGTVWVRGRTGIRKLAVPTHEYGRIKVGKPLRVRGACFDFNEGIC